MSQLGLFSAEVFADLTLSRSFLFSALISAVDPVAVLAIFAEIGVNPVLYFLVFGESLLNDAVTVVLYRMMAAFTEMEAITFIEILKGITSFFIVSLGGVFVGLIYGIITAFLTRITTHVRVVEPLAVLFLAYASYLTAELFEFSGIIAIIACGVLQAHYSFANISNDSETTVVNFCKMLASICDCIIFLFLGIETISESHVIDVGFIVLSIICCLLFRFLSVVVLTSLANRKRLRIVDYEEQFIMGYGGLRGAVCFSLVILITEEQVPHELKSLFITTTIVVIFFTVFVQGITMKPFVKWLKIETLNVQDQTINEELNSNLLDHVLEGVEVILGQMGSNIIRSKIEQIDEYVIKKFLQNKIESKHGVIMKAYQGIMLKEHQATVTAAKGQLESNCFQKRPSFSVYFAIGCKTSGDKYS